MRTASSVLPRLRGLLRNGGPVPARTVRHFSVQPNPKQQNPGGEHEQQVQIKKSTPPPPPKMNPNRGEPPQHTPTADTVPPIVSAKNVNDEKVDGGAPPQQAFGAATGGEQREVPQQSLSKGTAAKASGSQQTNGGEQVDGKKPSTKDSTATTTTTSSSVKPAVASGPSKISEDAQKHFADFFPRSRSDADAGSTPSSGSVPPRLWRVHDFSAGAKTYHERLGPHLDVVRQIENLQRMKFFFRLVQPVAYSIVRFILFLQKKQHLLRDEILVLEDWHAPEVVLKHSNFAYAELLRRSFVGDYREVYDVVNPEMEEKYFSVRSGSAGADQNALKYSSSKKEEERSEHPLWVESISLLDAMKKEQEEEKSGRAGALGGSLAGVERELEQFFSALSKGKTSRARMAAKEEEGKKSSAAGSRDDEQASASWSGSVEGSSSGSSTEGKAPDTNANRQIETKRWKFGPIEIEFRKFPEPTPEEQERRKPHLSGRQDEVPLGRSSTGKKKVAQEQSGEDEPSRSTNTSSSSVSPTSTGSAAASTTSTPSTSASGSAESESPEAGATREAEKQSHPRFAVVSSEVRFRKIHGPVLFHAFDEPQKYPLPGEVASLMDGDIDLHIDFDGAAVVDVGIGERNFGEKGTEVSRVVRADQFRLSCKFNLREGVASQFRLTQMQNLCLVAGSEGETN